MNFAQLLLILLARKRIILITMIVTIVSTAAVSLLLPKTYKATTSVLLNYKGIDPLTGVSMPGALLPGYVATQIDIITSKNVALHVVEKLGLAKSPAVIEQFRDATDGKGNINDWLADLLLKKVDIAPARESSVLDISFKGADPQFAAAVSNAFAEEYQKVSIQLKVEPAQKASAYFTQQTKLLRDAVEAAQSRLSKYQQENGIVSVDNRLDVESNRLNDLSAQLVMAQSQLAEAQSRQRLAKGSDSPDVAANPMIQQLRVSLASAESKQAELAERLGKNHPQYQSVQAEVEKMRTELRTQINNTSNSVGNSAQIYQQRESAIRAALQEQKAKVLELNRTRDELGVLAKDVESAQRAFDATSLRLSQTRLEGQSEQSDVAILNPAVPPVEPASPKIVLNVMLSVLIGGMLGVAIGFLAEMLDRRVRSEEDIADVLQVPVLGVFDWNAPARPRVGLIKSMLPRRLRLN